MSNVYNKADMVLVVAKSSGLDENKELTSDDALVGMSGYLDGMFKAESTVTPDKQYTEGELVCSFVTFDEETEENKIVSEWVDVPAFKTQPIPVTDIKWKSESDENIKVGSIDTLVSVSLEGADKTKYLTHAQTIKLSVENSDSTIVEITNKDFGADSGANIIYNLTLKGLKAGEATISVKHEYLDKTITKKVIVTEA
ncbi:hypothetical protein [Staphylococcus phage ZCSS1]|uniref:Major tail protein n=1 Tax=Staphylococcus phage UHP46 TaxID=3234966 RepID=A0AB39C8J9_9CAUD|nr:hypothetical protein [Staphylococcus phage ZCSS1]